jgi:hypothetical protein
MQKKVSKQSLHDTTIPQLVFHYVDACESVYKYRPYVPKKYYGKFSVFEDDLREMQISSMDYANSVVALTKKFVKGKGMKCLPINMFLGNYCLKVYNRYLSTNTVTVVDTDRQVMLYNELLVARFYIDKNIHRDGNSHIRMSDAIDELEPLLDKRWIALYENSKIRPIEDALEILCKEYKVKSADSYLEIVEALS